MSEEQANPPENPPAMPEQAPAPVLHYETPKRFRITPRLVGRVVLEGIMILLVAALAYVILLPAIQGPSANIQRQPQRRGANR